MSENNNHREEIFSKKVRAGHRTYFFDVKTTKSNDYYLTITESKRRNGDDGSPFYEKHKIFLYHEDFQNFLDAYNETIGRVNELYGDKPAPEPRRHEPTDHTPESNEQNLPEEKKAESPSGSSY